MNYNYNRFQKRITILCKVLTNISALITDMFSELFIILVQRKDRFFLSTYKSIKLRDTVLRLRCIYKDVYKHVSSSYIATVFINTADTHGSSTAEHYSLNICSKLYILEYNK